MIKYAHYFNRLNKTDSKKINITAMQEQDINLIPLSEICFMQLTTEQLAVINTQDNLVINAVAGSGKTTTLIEYAKTRPPQSKILYLAFNKTVKTEALQKFEAAELKNVKVETAHSLAFDHIIKFSQYKVVAGYSSYEWCNMLGIKTGDLHADFIIASHVGRFISYFCNSDAAKVSELNYAEVVSDAKAKTFVHNFYKLIEQYTREALSKMDKSDIAVTHDFYLKKFQLSQPALPYDYILFDEGQDASAAMLDVFLKQKAIKIIVGDTHQQIYGWRYAVNSLEKVDFPVYNLSSSFRFDDEIALIANKVLAWKKQLKLPDAIKINGAGKAGDLTLTRATLGRTNLMLLTNAIAQWQRGDIKKIYFEGNINSYTFAEEGASMYDILNLSNEKTDKIKDKLIGTMKTMKELDEYIEKTDDKSLRMIVDVVKEFGNKLPSLIAELKSNHTEKKEDADMIFSTIHRCKGMEYDEVTLLNDFINESKLQKQVDQNGGEKMNDNNRNRLAEEINILYVAATRAKSKLIIPPEINPLKSIQVSKSPAVSRTSTRYKPMDDEWKLYSRSRISKTSYSKTTNHGKRWNEAEEELLEQLFRQGSNMKEIAASLGRGEKGVRVKLIQLGLLDEDDVF
jgi:superfamily I DNA/RNA helicase